MVKKQRLSSMELLRIFSMLFIVTHHLVLNGLEWTNVSTKPLADNILLYNIGAVFESFCIIGVNLFFMLSGYFGIKQDWKKWINIVLTVYVYMIILQAVGLATGFNHLNMKLIMLVALPFNQYWFLKVYLVLMLVAPLLNVVIEQGSRKKELPVYFTIVFILVFCAYTFLDNDKRLGVGRGYSFVSACCLYLVGGFIHNGSILQKPKKASVCFMMYALAAGVNALIMLAAVNIVHKGKLASVLLVYNNPLVVAASVSFFLGFTRLKFNESGRAANIIRFFSSNVLAVYIIHSSNKVVPYYRNMLLGKIVSRYGVLTGFLCVIPYAVLIFIACIMIDKLFGLTIGKLIKLASDSIGNKLNNIQTKLCNKGKVE
ncbi:MAG: acyltransferase [Candidatus Ornithomonoglobus sp.]